MSYKTKALIKEVVNLKEILERILVGKMQVTLKKLQIVSPKLQIVLKKVLMSKREKRDLDKST